MINMSEIMTLADCGAPSLGNRKRMPQNHEQTRARAGHAIDQDRRHRLVGMVTSQ